MRFSMEVVILYNAAYVWHHLVQTELTHPIQDLWKNMRQKRHEGRERLGSLLVSIIVICHSGKASELVTCQFGGQKTKAEPMSSCGIKKAGKNSHVRSVGLFAGRHANQIVCKTWRNRSKLKAHKAWFVPCLMTVNVIRTSRSTDGEHDSGSVTLWIGRAGSHTFFFHNIHLSVYFIHVDSCLW